MNMGVLFCHCALFIACMCALLCLSPPAAGCYGPYCDIDPAGIFASPAAAASFKHCKLAGLPDLNHSSPGVLSRMQQVFEHTLAAYKPDGLQLDAVGHSDTVSKAELKALKKLINNNLQ